MGGKMINAGVRQDEKHALQPTTIENEITTGTELHHLLSNSAPSKTRKEQKE
jgi:hypothetical protein